MDSELKKSRQSYIFYKLSGIVCGIVAYFLLIGSPFFPAFATTTRTYTSRVDFQQGNFVGTEADSKEGDIKLQPAGSWNARVWKTPSLTLSIGSAIATDGTNVYVMTDRDNRFSKYIPQEDKFKELAKTPFTPYAGADMIYLNNEIYAIYGGYRKTLAKYSIATNTWTTLANAPDLINNGGSIETDGTNLYVLRGASTTDFWKYTVATNSWSVLAAPANTIGTGADLVFDNSTGTSYLYTPRGNGDTAMYRYAIAANTWTTMTAAPATLNEYGNISKKGDYIYVIRGQGTQTFYRYSISGNSWQTLTNTPGVARYTGLIYNAYEDRMYIFQGNGTYNWWKYNYSSGSYIGPSDLPVAPGTGSDFIYYNGYLYFRRGANTTTYYQYNISTDAWTALTGSSAAFNDDTKGLAVGGYIYYLRGGSTTDFFRYDISGNSWLNMSTAPSTSGNGASLAYPGSGDYIYATRGNNTTAFWRYTISSNTWSDAAAADLPTDNEAAYGSRLISDGTDIYAITGNTIPNLLKYTIGSNTWSSVGTLPFTPYYGTDVQYYSGKIYVTEGFYKRALWEYTIATNTWRRLSDMSGYYANDVGPYNGASIALDTLNNVFYITSGNGISRVLTYTPSNANYVASGTWISDTMDLSYVSSWNSVTVGSTTPSDSSIAIQSRTSSDLNTWTSWAGLSSGNITSTAQRYLQLKAILTSSSGQTSTPTLNSLTISYEGDTTAPTNPNSITALSQSVGGVSLVSGTSYGYQYPNFTWSGASDSQTSVAGYYVYFGTNNSADPVTSGTFQTSNSYSVTTPLDATTYYLRIKTKDVMGNVSATAYDAFTYVYSGISPPQSNAHTLSTDFQTGTTSNMDTSSDEIKLSSKAGFWTQSRLSTSPGGINYGAAFAYVSTSGKLYTFQGGNGTGFYSYDLSTNAWTSLAVAPATVQLGGGVVEGPSGYLYGARGNGTSTFWRYDIAGNSWSDVAAADAPLSFGYGGSLKYDGSRYIYALRGNSDDAFMRYDTQTDIWETLSNTDFDAPTSHPNNLVYVGGDLAYDSDGILYAIQGNTYTGFSSYSVASGNWTFLPDLPAFPNDGGQIEYDSTTNAIYYIPGWSMPFLYKFDLGTQTWSNLADAPSTFTSGASMRIVNGYIYVLRGGGNTTFWRYNIAKNSWEVPMWNLFGPEFRGSDPRSYGYGANIVKGNGNYFYLTRGNMDNQFIRYDYTTGESTILANAPSGFYQGGALVYDSTANKIYATTNNFVRQLYVYTITTDTWSTETADPPPFDVSTGAAMTYDGSRYIYWTRGGGNTTFYRFDTQGSSGSKWSSMAAASGTLNNGSDILYKGGYIYALRGNGTTSFYRYTVSGNTWSDPAVADLPTGANVNADGFLVDGGNNIIYACIGNNTVSCYQYSISGNTWTAIASPPANISIGGAGASNGSDRIFIIPGQGTNTYANGLYSYVIQTSTSSVQESGSFTSASHDLTSVYKYANLTVGYTSATNNTLTVSTRTSSDGTTFSSWSEASELKNIGTSYIYKITSPAARYIQVKFDLTSPNSISTGVITDYTINYYQDLTSPINPTSITATSTASAGVGLTSSNWYNFSSPYFDWPDADVSGGATDGSGGSGVNGYYVYFGTDSLADPLISGTYTTATSYTGSGMSTGNTYYLRIKTKDEGGNIAASSWDAFTYKYDTSLPINPSTIVANPPGYSNTNSFDFSWSGASDTGSTIAAYCYKTGALGSTDTCTTDTSVAGITAYTTGTNTFYLRTKDSAGNYSTDYATASYYYSSTAPGGPQALAVTPSSNTANEFAFSWSPPSTYYGTQSGLRYYYSVNALPTAHNVNTVGLSVTYLSASAYATQKGVNTMYVVAKDEAGNIDYNNYSSITFTADTSAPGIPTDIDIADVSVKETKSWKLAISWEPPATTGSGVSQYKVYRSTTAGALCSTDFDSFTYASSTTGKSFVDTDLSQVKYAYCVKACTSTNDCSAPSDTVSFLPDGKWRVSPALTADPTVSAKTRTATISWSTSRTANSFVKYGKSSGTYGDEVGSSEQVTYHEIDLSSLDPGTTYYYKVLWTDEDGNTGESDEKTFETGAAPVVSEVKINNIGLSNAYVTFKVKNAIKVNVQYGKTITYGLTETISTSKSESNYTVQLTSLIDGTAYHFRIVGEDDEGNAYNGDDYSFETLPVPKITALKIQQVEGMPTATLRLLWTTNTRLSSVVSYYPVGQPALAKDSINLALSKVHEAVIRDLKEESDYVFIVKGRDIGGNEAKADERKIKTAEDLRPPEITNVQVETSIIGVGDAARAQATITWDTDEPATSQVDYGEGTSGTYSSSTQEDPILTFNHAVTVPALAASKIYHFRMAGADKKKNRSTSSDVVIITPNATKDALNLVVDKLSVTFGFLKKSFK